MSKIFTVSLPVSYLILTFVLYLGLCRNRYTVLLEKGQDMTRKHYRLIAEAIRTERASIEARECDPSKMLDQWSVTARVANSLADILQADNPRFRRETFLEACGI